MTKTDVFPQTRYPLTRSIAFFQDEWSKFAHTLVDIKQNKIDQEDWDKIGSINPGMRQFSGMTEMLPLSPALFNQLL